MKSPDADFGNNMSKRMGKRMGEKMSAGGKTPFVTGSSAPSSQKGPKTPFADASALVNEARPAKAPKARLKPVFSGTVPGPGSHKPKPV